MPLVLGADGAQQTYTMRGAGACCPVLFPSACAMKCNFIQLLPEGPLWDIAKAEALAHYSQGAESNVCVAAPNANPSCASMVNYAAYLGDVLLYAIEEIIWPGVRESNPFTAATSLDSWLDRLQWQDCFATLCRSTLLGQLTPYEVQGPDGPILCDIPISDELACAVKKGILAALLRLQVAGVKTLDVINWIIEPLDSILSPDPGSEGCADVSFTIRPATGFLAACQTEGSNRPLDVQLVPSVYVPRLNPDNCGTQPAGLPHEIYPATVAAECIVRSILPRSVPNIINRGCLIKEPDTLALALAAMTPVGRMGLAGDAAKTTVLYPVIATS